jgi:anthranilate phosphoribosyltransferase
MKGDIKMTVPTGTIVVGLIELGKLGLQAYLQAMRMAGKTPEEIDKMYQEERTYFDMHPPDTLPDVSEDNLE